MSLNRTFSNNLCKAKMAKLFGILLHNSLAFNALIDLLQKNFMQTRSIGVSWLG